MRMMSHPLRNALAFVALCLPSVVHADDDAARNLVDRVREAAPKVTFVAKGTLTSDRGWVRELELYHKHMGNDIDASYMEVTAPLDLKDTRFLVFDHKTGRDEQWIFVPQAKRAIQVGQQTRKQAFLGSEFSNGDLVQPDLNDFTYRFIGEEDVLGRHCKLVEVVPKTPADEMYSKSILAIDPNDLLVIRGQFYDDSGKLLKTLTIAKYDKVEGNWTPQSQEMRDAQDSHWSKLELSDIKYNAQIPDETFAKSYLTR